MISSRTRGEGPLDVTVGTDHPRLPGLGLGLVGLGTGGQVRLTLTPEQAYGLPDPARVRRLARTRFTSAQVLAIGRWVRILDGRGRRRSVRILEVRERSVVVDGNHRRAGQSLVLEVEVVGIRAAGRDGGEE